MRDAKMDANMSTGLLENFMMWLRKVEKFLEEEWTDHIKLNIDKPKEFQQQSLYIFFIISYTIIWKNLIDVYNN